MFFFKNTSYLSLTFHSSHSVIWHPMMKKTIQQSIGLGLVKIKVKNLKIVRTSSTSISKPKELNDFIDDKQDNERTGSQSDPHEDDEDDGSTLLSTQPGFNKLLMVLRDEKVMRFVKYVSASAPGSRWDICGEYEVGMLEESDSESEKS